MCQGCHFTKCEIIRTLAVLSGLFILSFYNIELEVEKVRPCLSRILYGVWLCLNNNFSVYWWPASNVLSHEFGLYHLIPCYVPPLKYLLAWHDLSHLQF